MFVVSLVLYSLRTIRFARFECDALTHDAVKRLANQSRVNCLYAMIGQSDKLSYGAGNIIYLGHRGLVGTKKRRRRSVSAVVSNV